jgi:hypothetical protein
MLNRCGKQLRVSGYVIVCVLMGVVGALLVVGWASALQAPGVEVGPDHARQAYVGDTILYHHTLTNTGATTDTFTLEVLSTRGWPVELVGATQPTGTLSLQVAAQMAAPFQISLTVPAGAVGLTDTTVVTATSQLSPTVQDSTTDTTTVVPHRIILPLVTKRWPPVPYPTTLNPIDNADKDGYYAVSWSPAGLADTYVLEEDGDAGFSSPTIVYNGASTYWSVPDPGRAPGTYYYRVRGHNQWGYGDYSNVQAVTVGPTFRVVDTDLTAGQCTTLVWDFTGIKELHVVLGYGYDEQPVPGQDARQVCPSVSTTYKAIATKQDDSQEIYQATVHVTGSGCGDPIIWDFFPSTYQVQAGGIVLISWRVECAKGVWLIYDGTTEAVVGQSYRAMSIAKKTLFKLKVKKTNGSFVYASFTVKLK